MSSARSRTRTWRRCVTWWPVRPALPRTPAGRPSGSGIRTPMCISADAPAARRPSAASRSRCWPASRAECSVEPRAGWWMEMLTLPASTTSSPRPANSPSCVDQRPLVDGELAARSAHWLAMTAGSVDQRRLTFHPDGRFSVAAGDVIKGKDQAMTSVRQPVERADVDHEHAPARPSRRVRWMLGMSVLVGVVALAAGAYLVRAAPRPRPASSPLVEFSADRALPHVKQIAAVPHPVGSAANARARDYILGELGQLGLQPRVLRATTARGNEVARVENIHARIPGRDGTGHVVLAAHYDSASQAPGAADDAAGVAAILETARALRAGVPLRNDIDLLITDGEEPGLLGAHAFVTAGVIDPSRSVVLNLEAGGSSGPSLVFQTSPGNNGLIKAIAGLEDPAGGSELAALFELLPNDTDFTVFRDAGFAGLNLIFGDGHVQYHSPTDTPANLDRSSLQHHGDNLLTLARTLGEQQLPLPPGGDATFFTLFDWLVWYPDGLVVPFALLAVGAFAATLWHARRRGTRLRAVIGAAATVPLLLAAAGGLGVAAWSVLGLLRPAYRSLDWGATYRPQWYVAGLTVLAVTVTVAWYLLVRRRLSTLETVLGVLTWLAGLAVTVAFLEPRAAYLLTWPALVGSLGLAIGLRLTGRGS